MKVQEGIPLLLNVRQGNDAKKSVEHFATLNKGEFQSRKSRDLIFADGVAVKKQALSRIDRLCVDLQLLGSFLGGHGTSG